MKGPGVATLSRYGVVVFFDVLPVEEMAFLAHLQPPVTNPYPMPEIEELEVRIEPGSPESVKGGVAYLENAAVERLQVIADILSKSALLSLYEKKVAVNSTGSSRLPWNWTGPAIFRVKARSCSKR